MKVNILLNNPNQIVTGYTNIDPFATGKDARIEGNINLTNAAGEQLVFDGEAEEIVAHEILDYFPAQQIDNIIQTWIKKLAFNGKLTISTIDLEVVSRAVVFGHFKSILESHELLYGKQREPWEYRKICMSSQVLVEYMEKAGLKILEKFNVNYRFCITAIRPHPITNL